MSNAPKIRIEPDLRSPASPGPDESPPAPGTPPIKRIKSPRVVRPSVPVNPEASTPPQKMRKPAKQGGGWFRYFLVFSLLALLSGAGIIGGAYFYYSQSLPPLYNLADYRPSLVTRVYARDYQLLGEFFFQRRQFVPMNEVPRLLVNAFLAIEDSKYYQHPGVDLIGIFRAAIANLRAGRAVQGASTITQQVAKTFLLSSVKSIERKVKEIILALRIEKQFTKDEVLELYVNQIYLGAGAYGVGAAARIYFNRDVSELTLGQMALLAGLPKAPTHYSPWKFQERSQKRQRLVLNRMVETGFVTQEEADAAAAAPLGLARPQEPLEVIAPHYLEHVRRIILGDWGEGQLYRGGLDVYTALDPTLQRVAQNALRQGLVDYDRRHGYRGVLEHLDKSQDSLVRQAWIDKKRPNHESVFGYLLGLVTEVSNQRAQVLLLDNRKVDLPFEGVAWARKRQDKGNREKYVGPAIRSIPEVLRVGDVILVDPPRGTRKVFHLAQEPDAEAALVSLDPHTGQVHAMVGGLNYKKSQFNRATQGQRQPGSSFKPFVYAAALDNGMTPVTMIDDSPMPVTYTDSATGEKKVWQAQNYERKFYGPTTLRVGLVHSRNLVTIRILKKIGIPYMVEFMKKINFDIPEAYQNLSLALGTVGFTPLKIAAGYTMFANSGKYATPVYITRVQDRLGRTVHRHRGGDCLLCHRELEQSINLDGPVKKVDNPPLFGKPALDPATAYQVTSLLKGVITHGTGQRAKTLRRPLAGKTGTTNDLRDAWFVGFSPSLVTAVWVGMDDNSTLGYRETGAQAALPIWIDYMGEALKDIPPTDFSVPKGIVLEEIDAETGEPASAGTRQRVMEAFKPDQRATYRVKDNTPDASLTEETVPSLEEGLY